MIVLRRAMVGSRRKGTPGESLAAAEEGDEVDGV